jgi:hypothetical protein
MSAFRTHVEAPHLSSSARCSPSESRCCGHSLASAIMRHGKRKPPVVRSQRRAPPLQVCVSLCVRAQASGRERRDPRFYAPKHSELYTWLRKPEDLHSKRAVGNNGVRAFVALEGLYGNPPVYGYLCFCVIVYVTICQEVTRCALNCIAFSWLGLQRPLRLFYHI